MLGGSLFLVSIRFFDWKDIEIYIFFNFCKVFFEFLDICFWIYLKATLKFWIFIWFYKILGPKNFDNRVLEEHLEICFGGFLSEDVLEQICEFVKLKPIGFFLFFIVAMNKHEETTFMLNIQFWCYFWDIKDCKIKVSCCFTFFPFYPVVLFALEMTIKLHFKLSFKKSYILFSHSLYPKWSFCILIWLTYLFLIAFFLFFWIILLLICISFNLTIYISKSLFKFWNIILYLILFLIQHFQHFHINFIYNLRILF